MDASELAPAPEVDEDPIATIVIGLPFLSFVAMWDKRIGEADHRKRRITTRHDTFSVYSKWQSDGDDKSPDSE